MARMQEPLKRRIAPAVALTLDLIDDDGSKMQRTFRLSFDFNAFALVSERTGIDMANKFPFANLAPHIISMMLWAAALACHPEYGGEDGLAIIRSYMDAGNVELIEEKLWEAWLLNMPEKQREFWKGLREEVERGADPTRAAPKQGPEPQQANP